MRMTRLVRLTHDAFHNAFTGAAWFKGALYIAYRLGDGHVCNQGRLVVQRSRDGGHTFDTVHVARGEFDTRDANLYVADDALWLTGFEADPNQNPRAIFSGSCHTRDGLRWSNWQRCTGADGYVLWRPRWFKGTHYVAGYATAAVPGVEPVRGEIALKHVAWFTSPDGVNWTLDHMIHEGDDRPNETFIEFQPDGSVVALLRRETQVGTPILMRSKPPYKEWAKQELDIKLRGPTVFVVAGRTYIGGRWFINPQNGRTALFEVDDHGKCHLQMTLPSGPGWDHSYISVAQQPGQPFKRYLSYYSEHGSLDVPNTPPVGKTDIYMAEVIFPGGYLENWLATAPKSAGTWPDAPISDPAIPVKALGEISVAPGFVDLSAVLQPADSRLDGTVFCKGEYHAPYAGGGVMSLGHDAPIRVWLNGSIVYEAKASPPAVPDAAAVSVIFAQGANRIEIAFDSRAPRSSGFFCRCATDSIV